MKSILLILVILATILIFTQCKKSPTTHEQTAITYPLTGNFGINILNVVDSAVINPQLEYSLAANLESNARLKIIMTNLSSSSRASWFFNSASNQNWNISEYNTILDQQTFISNQAGSLDLFIEFDDTLGNCKIDFYENSSQTPTISKHLTWHQIQE